MPSVSGLFTGPTSGTNLGNLVVHLTAEAGQFHAEFDHIQEHVEGTMEQLATTVEVGTAAMVAAFVALSVEAIHEAEKLEEAMISSTAAMRGLSDQMREEMTDNARHIANSSRDSAATLAAGYGAMKAAGYGAEQQIAALGVAEKYATASGQDLVKSTSELTGILQKMGLASEDATENAARMAHVSDLIVQGAAVGKTSVGDLAEAMDAGARTFKRFNMTADEGVAVMLAFAEKGKRGAEAGSGLELVLRSMENGMLKHKETWQEFGITIHDASGNLLPLTDIVKQFQVALAGTSDEQKRTSFEMLGMDARALKVFRTLLDTNDAIGHYTELLGDAGGATDDVANVRMSTFEKQLSVVWHRINDILIKVGQELMPLVLAAVQEFDEWTQSVDGFGNAARDVADIIKTVWLVTFDAVYSQWISLKVLWLEGQIILTKLAQVFEVLRGAGEVALLANVAVVAKAIQFWKELSLTAKIAWKELTGDSDGADKADRELQRVQKEGTAAGAALLKAAGDYNHFLLEMDKGTDVYSEAMKKMRQDQVDALANAKLPSQVLAEQAEKMTKLSDATWKAEQASHKFWESIKVFNDVMAESKQHLVETGAETKNLTVELVALHELLYPWKKETENLAKYKELHDAFLISDEEYRRALATIVDPSAVDPMDKALSTIERLDFELSKGALDANQYALAVGKVLSQASKFIPDDILTHPNSSLQVDTGITDQDTLNKLQHQEQLYKDSYDRWKKMVHDSVVWSEEDKARIQAKGDKIFLAQTQAWQTQHNELILNSGQQMFDSLGQISLAFAGSQSGIYKTMFAVSKAFAIADAVVKIQQGIAGAALAEPWWMKIPAMAQVAAASASIVSNIMAVRMAGFEGGGMTPSGARTGGLDGRGGMLAVLHPDEKVTDLTKPNTDASGVTVNIHNYAGAEVQTQTDNSGRILDVIINKARKMIASDIRDGRGVVPAAIEASYGFTRGNGNNQR